MTDYLANLIGRHTPSDSGESSVAVVSPRPKYRFEAEQDHTQDVSMQTNNSTFTSAADIVPAEKITELNLSNEMEGQTAQKRPLNIFDKGMADTGFAQPDNSSKIQTSSENRSLQSSPNTFPNKNSDQQPALGLHANERVNVLSDFSDKENSQQYSELQNTIDSVLLRLNERSMPSQTSVNENLFTTKQETGLHSGSLANSLVEPGEVSEQNIETSSSADLISQDITPNSIDELAQSRESEGILNTPNWLNEMQASLSQQFQKLKQQMHANTPEPVVNVTIGRVEIRAVQTNTPKQKTQKKPTGVMSLDEYLQHRKNRVRS